jgi:hypothetical protein
MMDARKAYVVLRNAGLMVVLIGLAAVLYYGFALRHHVRENTPHLDGEPGPLREVLAFPWSDFPTIPDVERQTLGNLIPINPPLRLSDIHPWVNNPTDPVLGAREAPRNKELQAALDILRGLAAKHAAADEGTMPVSSTAGEDRPDLDRVKIHLALAEQRPESRAFGWLISYNRGVVYHLQDNRQKAATEFKTAYNRLKRRNDVSPSAETLSAMIHVQYALGDSLIPPGNETGRAPMEAIRHLREAVVKSVQLFATAHPSGVAHAAEFFDLEPPTGLSTRALRNDLIAAYLITPDYKECSQPMTEDTCSQTVFPGPCGYRNKQFCQTRDKVSNRLSEVYRRELEKYINQETSEGTMWALQSVAELESENVLDDDPQVSYNVAHLLLTLKRPDLAYSYIAPVTTRGDQTKVTQEIENLAFVTSILSGATPAAMSEGSSDEEQLVSEYRTAYKQQYGDKSEPEPFRPLRVGNPQKTRTLDAWLFIRRYRYLLERGRFETFEREHRNLMQMKIDKSFLQAWRTAVVQEFLQRVRRIRDAAAPDARNLIDQFVARNDLFSTAELKAAGLSRPFWSPARLAWVRFLAAFLFWLLFTAFYLWLCAAYRWTFISAYREEREAAARENRGYA